jgi:anti-sigma factor RsiW
MLCSLIRDDLLEVLYDEAPPATSARVEEHLAVCPACRDDLDSLRAVRGDLVRWTLPPGLGEPAPAAGRTRTWAWLGAAAAGLVLALGGALGLSGSELSYNDGTLAFRLGRGPEPVDVQRLLAEQEERHRQEIRALAATRAPAPARIGRDDEALLRQVEQMIRDSEARQAALLGASLGDLSTRAEAQRRYDLARVSAGLSYLDGKTGEQVARTTELMGYVLQAAQER